MNCAIACFNQAWLVAGSRLSLSTLISCHVPDWNFYLLRNDWQNFENEGVDLRFFSFPCILSYYHIVIISLRHGPLRLAQLIIPSLSWEKKEKKNISQECAEPKIYPAEVYEFEYIFCDCNIHKNKNYIELVHCHNFNWVSLRDIPCKSPSCVRWRLRVSASPCVNCDALDHELDVMLKSCSHI